MKYSFCIVGPTATGKSELAADVARDLDAEIVSADAFQIYRGFDLLTAKPDAATVAKVPHHLIGTISILEEMNAAKSRGLALQAISEIHSRGKEAIVVGGSGLYVKALTHELSPLPPADPELRANLNAMTLDQLRDRLIELDPETADRIDMKNRRRLVRAIEIRSLQKASVATALWAAPHAGVSKLSATLPTGKRLQGVFVFRDRAELYARINRRVEAMFENGVIEEVRATGSVGATASQMIGLREIRQLLAGEMSLHQCIATIQQATRRYAKRQLTWFRLQTNFEPLNLSLLTYNEAVKCVSQKASLSSAQGND